MQVTLEQTKLQNEDMGWFIQSDGSKQRCIIEQESNVDYGIRYFDTNTQLFEFAFVQKTKVKRDFEVEEKAFWVIKHKTQGSYYGESSASGPKLFKSKGRAEGRIKTLPRYTGGAENYEVVKWVISERED